MRKFRWMILAGVAALLACAGAAVAQDSADAGATELAGTVDAVTVYRGQALVTRLVDVPAQGAQELVVTDLPAQVLPGSIHAESADGLEVRSVRFRTRPVQQDVHEEVQTLDDKIQQVQRRLDELSAREQVLAEQKSYIDSLGKFTHQTASLEVSKGVLNAESLTTLSQFLFEQRERISGAMLEVRHQQADIKEQLNLLQRHKQRLTSDSSRTAREAVVFVNADRANAQLRLRYLVRNASWSPSYTARANGEGGQVELTYLASVRQQSGENWKNVRMTLSTATPNLAAEPPTLDPMELNLVQQSQQQQVSQTKHQLQEKLARLEQQQMELNMARNTYLDEQPKGGRARAGRPREDRDGAAGAREAAPPQQGTRSDARLNDIAGQKQRIEWSAAFQEEVLRREQEESVSVVYDLPGRIALPSRPDQQLVQIATTSLDADTYRVATPLLTEMVYREASVTNGSDRVLLAGPVSSYMDGTFVGRGQIRTVAIGEQFKVGFGADSSLRAERTLADKSSQIQGGNKVMTFEYKLSLENFGSEPAEVRV
ncbi:MAG: mucoidy inhibitor MuiA family protein, partial [Planctomycetota bacterium]